MFKRSQTGGSVIDDGGVREDEIHNTVFPDITSECSSLAGL